MDDYSELSLGYSSEIAEVDGTEYLVQGELSDPLVMFRPVDELLEFERDAVQTMPYYSECWSED